MTNSKIPMINESKSKCCGNISWFTVILFSGLAFAYWKVYVSIIADIDRSNRSGEVLHEIPRACDCENVHSGVDLESDISEAQSLKEIFDPNLDPNVSLEASDVEVENPNPESEPPTIETTVVTTTTNGSNITPLDGADTENLIFVPNLVDGESPVIFEEDRVGNDLQVEVLERNDPEMNQTESIQSIENPQKTILIGVSTGRSGTTALTELLNKMDNTFIHHEYKGCNGIEWPQLNNPEASQLTNEAESYNITERINNFKNQMISENLNLVGDIAPWNLPHLEKYFLASENVKILGLIREKEATINSWTNFLKKFNNFIWLDSNFRQGTKFTPTNYEKCFPHYTLEAFGIDPNGVGLIEGLQNLKIETGAEVYYNAYNGQLLEFYGKYVETGRMKVFNTNQLLSDFETQKELYKWLGLIA